MYSILIIFAIHIPLLLTIRYLLSLGKHLINIDLTKKKTEEETIKEGISIPSFEFNISKSTIGFLLITLSILLLIFTTNSILKNMQNNIDFIKKTFIIDNNLSKSLQKNQIQIQKSQTELSTLILTLINNKKDGNATK